MENTKSLADLLKTEATEEDYQEFVDKLIEHVQKLYREYEYTVLSPEVHSYADNYTLTFVLSRTADRELFKELFQLAMSKGLKDDEINKKLVEEAEKGNIIPLGSDEIEIDNQFTGTSSILQGQDMQIFLAFTTPELRDKREEAEEQGTGGLF